MEYIKTPSLLACLVIPGMCEPELNKVDWCWEFPCGLVIDDDLVARGIYTVDRSQLYGTHQDHHTHSTEFKPWSLISQQEEVDGWKRITLKCSCEVTDAKANQSFH